MIIPVSAQHIISEMALSSSDSLYLIELMIVSHLESKTRE